MQIHQIKRNTENRKPAPVGRGGKRGKTSGRGGKGQTARAGNKVRPMLRDAIKKLPKLRGYRFKSIQVKPSLVNIRELEAVVTAGTALTPAVLVELGLVNKTKGNVPKVKILGTGTLTKKLTVSGCAVSASAKAAIEKAGGEVK